jgi:hypothetical protein
MHLKQKELLTSDEAVMMQRPNNSCEVTYPHLERFRIRVAVISVDFIVSSQAEVEIRSDDVISISWSSVEPVR